MNPNNLPFWFHNPFETDSSHLPETNALPLTYADLYNLSHERSLGEYVDLDPEQLYGDKLSDEEVFFDAIKSQDLVKVNLFLQKDAAFANLKDVKGLSPLIWAINEDSVSTTDDFVECWTMSEDSICIIDSLIKHGADVNEQHIDGTRPLHVAADKGYKDIVAMLVEKGADKEVRNDEDKTPLHLAAEKGHIAIVKMLAELGADINTQDNQGMTPLNSAVREGHHGVVEYLIGFGANIHLADTDGSTPLLQALQTFHDATSRKGMLECLLSSGNSALFAHTSPNNSCFSESDVAFFKENAFKTSAVINPNLSSSSQAASSSSSSSSSDGASCSYAGPG